MSWGKTVERWNLEPSRWMRSFALSFATERCATPAGMSAAYVCELINNYATPSKRSFFQALAISERKVWQFLHNAACSPLVSHYHFAGLQSLFVESRPLDCHARKVQAVQPCRCDRAHLRDLSHHVVNRRRSYKGTSRSTKVTKVPYEQLAEGCCLGRSRSMRSFVFSYSAKQMLHSLV